MNAIVKKNLLASDYIVFDILYTVVRFSVSNYMGK